MQQPGRGQIGCLLGVESGVGMPVSPAWEAVSEERRLVHLCSEDGARLEALLPVENVPTLLS